MASPHGVNPEHARHYLEAAPDAIVAVDDGGIIVMVNQQARILFGYEGDSLLGESIDKLVPESVQMAHRAHRTRYRAAPRIRQMGDPGARLSAARANGTLVPVEVALSPVQVDDDQLVMAVIRDVSDRVQAEAEQEAIRQSLDAVDDAVFMFDHETLRFTYVNAGAVRQTGYSRDELVGGMTPLHIKPEYTEDEFRRLLAPLAAESLQSSTFTTVHRTKSGRDIPVEIVMSYPRTSSDLARPMVALVRDITARRASERRLEESERAFRSAFDDAGVPMAIVDLTDPGTRRVIEANRALGDMLGYDTSELPGLSFVELTHPDDRLADDAGANQVADRNGDFRTEKRYRRADGTYLWGALHASLIDGPDGQPRSLAHIVDVTRRIRAENDRDRREAQLVALAEIRKAALDESPTEKVLSLVVEVARSSLTARHCLIATPDEHGALICRAMASPTVIDFTGQPLPNGDVTSSVMSTAEPALVPGLEIESEFAVGKTASLGPTLVVPLSAASSIEGVLIMARDVGSAEFDPDEVAAANALAAEAAVTLVLGRARVDRRRMFLAEDRERIARDLHDLVIQRIFATGMALQAGVANPESLSTRAMETVDELDATIGVIREAIFHLTRPDDSLTGEINRLVDRRRSVGRNAVELEVYGDLETVPRAIHDQLVPTLNELLSNVQRHANADLVRISVTVLPDKVQLTVADDGVGIAVPTSSGLGLRNLTSRALSLGGSMSFGPRSTGGTEVVWTVPIPDDLDA